MLRFLFCNFDSGDEDVPRRDRHAAVAAAQARREKSFGGDAGDEVLPRARNTHNIQTGGDETYNRVQEARLSSSQEKKNKYSIQKRGYVADEEAVRVSVSLHFFFFDLTISLVSSGWPSWCNEGYNAEQGTNAPSQQRKEKSSRQASQCFRETHSKEQKSRIWSWQLWWQQEVVSSCTQYRSLRLTHFFRYGGESSGISKTASRSTSFKH